MLDLLPLAQKLPVGFMPTDSRVIKQRRFVDFKKEEFAQFVTQHSEIIKQTIDYINQRVKSRLQDDVRTQNTIQLGKMGLYEYLKIFDEKCMGRLSCGHRRALVNGTFIQRKAISHSFVIGRDSHCFDFTNSYSTSTDFPYCGYEITHTKSFGVKSFKFLYFPELQYAQITIHVTRDCKRDMRRYEPKISE